MKIKLYRIGSLESTCITIEENAYTAFKQAFSSRCGIIQVHSSRRCVLKIKPSDYLPIVEIVEE